MKDKEIVFKELGEAVHELSRIEAIPKNSRFFKDRLTFKHEVVTRLKLIIYQKEKELF